MSAGDFHYELPRELIAQEPLAERSASRLLVLAVGGQLHDAGMRELPRWLSPGDLLIFNDTRVVPARLAAAKPTGGQVEILLERALEGSAALVQLRASKPIRPGLVLETAGGPIEVVRAERDLWCVALPSPGLDFFRRWGQVPLPPYIQRPPRNSDRERYQCIFARTEGAVAAPTAGLHFDAALLSALAQRGIEQTFITLHVGAGTFQPIRSADASEHVMHAERASVGAEACGAIARTRARGGRVIAVGTTVVRALETAAQEGACTDGGSSLGPWHGETRLFIRPGFEFRVIDGLITNFHLPGSTLLMLVCAFAGRERVLGAYEHAVRLGYRFFSYGDAMLIAPARLPRGDARAI